MVFPRVLGVDAGGLLGDPIFLLFFVRDEEIGIDLIALDLQAGLVGYALLCMDWSGPVAPLQAARLLWTSCKETQNLSTFASH